MGAVVGYEGIGRSSPPYEVLIGQIGVFGTCTKAVAGGEKKCGFAETQGGG